MGPIGGHISYTSDSSMSHHDETMMQSIPLYDQLAGNAGTSKTCCRHLPLGLADGKGHDRSRAWERDGRVMGRKTSKAFFPYAYGRAPTGCQGEDTYEQEGHPSKWNTSEKRWGVRPYSQTVYDFIIQIIGTECVVLHSHVQVRSHFWPWQLHLILVVLRSWIINIPR